MISGGESWYLTIACGEASETASETALEKVLKRRQKTHQKKEFEKGIRKEISSLGAARRTTLRIAVKRQYQKTIKSSKLLAGTGRRIPYKKWQKKRHKKATSNTRRSPTKDIKKHIKGVIRNDLPGPGRPSWGTIRIGIGKGIKKGTIHFILAVKKRQRKSIRKGTRKDTRKDFSGAVY